MIRKKIKLRCARSLAYRTLGTLVLLLDGALLFLCNVLIPRLLTPTVCLNDSLSQNYEPEQARITKS
jgi:hypothetical protein